MLRDVIHSGSDILAFIILFGFSIFVHELGHFLMALRCGMVVDTFSLGFGPAIWKRKIRGVIYKIGWIPFGGYVALPQLDPSGMAAYIARCSGESCAVPA
jgi:regulator of sigma E protease